MLCHLWKLEIINIRFLGFTEVLRKLKNSKKQAGIPASQETLCHLWMPRFIAAFTTARHCCLS